jgi:hypothetical protein
MVRLTYCDEKQPPKYAIPFIFRKYNEITDGCEDKWFVMLSIYDYTTKDIEWMDSDSMGKIVGIPSVDLTYKAWECDTEQEAFGLVAQLWAEYAKSNSLNRIY